MAKQQRRLPGELCETVLDALRRAGRPMSGHTLALELVQAGHRVFSSQVFRTVNQLYEQRRIQRVELMNSYVPGGPGGTANLVCSACGSLTRIHVPAVFDDLTALANRQGMKVDRLIVESSGLCQDCRDSDEPAASQPHVAVDFRH